jgi:hypothetical protein
MKHEDKIQEFLRGHLLWERYNLRKKLNVMFDKEETLGVPLLGFIPDAFQIDAPNCTVRLLEVDGHSYTDNDKMFLIAEFWYEMDVRSWFVELHTVHLFTNATSILTDSDLAKHWFSQYAVD